MMPKHERILESERRRAEHGSPTYLLSPDDIGDTISMEVINIRVKERMDGLRDTLTGLIQEDPCMANGKSNPRDQFHGHIYELINMLHLVRHLHLFPLDSAHYHALRGLISLFIRYIDEHVYIYPKGESLLDNEWLLLQNDLARFVQIAFYAPSVGAFIGQEFGYTTLHLCSTLNYSVDTCILGRGRTLRGWKRQTSRR